MFCCARTVLQNDTKWIPKIMLQNDQWGPWILVMQKQLSCIDVTTPYGTVITQILVSQTRKLLHITQIKIQNDHFLPYIFSLFCIVNSKYWVFIFIPNVLLSDEKKIHLVYKMNTTNHIINLIFSQNMFLQNYEDLSFDRLYQRHILLRNNPRLHKPEASCYIFNF